MLNHINLDKKENFITDEGQLTDIFYSGVKNCSAKNVGLEFEKLPVLKINYKAAPYSEVAKFLHGYGADGCNGIFENQSILGLSNSQGTITLEPGSQTELSLVPQGDLLKLKQYIDVYNKKTAQIAQNFGIYWLGCGIQPVSTYKNINIIPKKRYEYMTKYLPTVAAKPLIMMRETAGIQASFDYESEEDAMKKFAFALKLSPIISAAYANSPIRNGRLTKLKSNRAASWLETDNDRCGLVSSKVFKGEFSFEDYAQILLDVPMIFIERTIKGVKTALKVENLTFRQFLKNGYEHWHATKEDWELHLSLYFPDVRLKTYIEIRNHDNQKSDLICSVPALWKGLIYNTGAMESVNDLLKGFAYFDFEYLRRKTPQYGLDMRIKHFSLKDIVKEIVQISYDSLKGYGQSEEKLLEPFLELIKDGATPADVVIRNWNGCWGSDIEKFAAYSRLS